MALEVPRSRRSSGSFKTIQFSDFGHNGCLSPRLGGRWLEFAEATCAFMIEALRPSVILLFQSSQSREASVLLGDDLSVLDIEWASSIGILKADQHDRLSGGHRKPEFEPDVRI